MSEQLYSEINKEKNLPCGSRTIVDGVRKLLFPSLAVEGTFQNSRIFVALEIVMEGKLAMLAMFCVICRSEASKVSPRIDKQVS